MFPALSLLIIRKKLQHKGKDIRSRKHYVVFVCQNCSLIDVILISSSCNYHLDILNNRRHI